ncbi:MAG: TonB-dependent receptor domain-containing protein, partial [Blastocatellia bacterium]
FSGAAGINVGLWEGGAFVANFSHSHRAPALEELYNNGPHIGNVTFEIGNENLQSERANGVDFSLRHQSSRFSITGDVFYYRIDNFVFLAPQDEDGDGDVDIEDGLPVGRYEQADASYFGAEISAEASFNKYIGAFASLDMVRAKLIDDEINIPRIPPARAKVGLDLRYKDLSIRPEAIFAADQEKVFPLETRTAGYGLFNVAGSYTIGRQHYAHIFSFNAFNLTNRLYRNHINFIKDFLPEVGRGLRVGYTIRIF